MSSLSHHYSWYKALISLKPLLAFLLPTSAYQQAGLSSFTTHKLGGEGRPQMSGRYKVWNNAPPPKGNRKRSKQLHPTAKAFKFSGFKTGLGELNFESLSSKSSPQTKHWKKLQCLNFIWAIPWRGKNSLRYTVQENRGARHGFSTCKPYRRIALSALIVWFL